MKRPTKTMLLAARAFMETKRTTIVRRGSTLVLIAGERWGGGEQAIEMQASSSPVAKAIQSLFESFLEQHPTTHPYRLFEQADQAAAAARWQAHKRARGSRLRR